MHPTLCVSNICHQHRCNLSVSPACHFRRSFDFFRIIRSFQIWIPRTVRVALIRVRRTEPVIFELNTVRAWILKMINGNFLVFSYYSKNCIFKIFIVITVDEMFFPCGDVIYYVVTEWCWMMLLAHLLVTACIHCSSTNRTSFHGTILDSRNWKCKHKQK